MVGFFIQLFPHNRLKRWRCLETWASVGKGLLSQVILISASLDYIPTTSVSISAMPCAISATSGAISVSPDAILEFS